MLRRKLACSFCGRSEADVQKLVAGPHVYICDRCAADVVRIMEQPVDTMPPSSSARGGLFRTVRRQILGLWRRRSPNHRTQRVATQEGL